jgi:hypothetical protein
MADNIHPVVELLAARMESHPEEFNADDGRWAQFLDELIPFVTEEERVMLRKPMMQTIHEGVLDELLNGPERRRKAEEERNEYERHMAAAMQHTKQQKMLQAIQQYGGGGGGASLPVSLSPYQNAAGQGIVGKPLHQVWLDDYVYNSSITASQPETTLSKSTISAIKKALGIKK